MLASHGRKLRSNRGLNAARTTDYRPSILKGRASDCKLVDRRELGFDLGLNAVCTTDYRPSILKGCTPDCRLAESRKLVLNLSLNALCVSGYQISIFSGRSDGLTVDAPLDANLSGSISECLLLDGRKLRSNHGFDTVCISHWFAASDISDNVLAAPFRTG